MANLTVYTDRGVRSSAAKAKLNELGITFTEVNVADDSNARSLLEAKRSLGTHPCPQFYVGDQLAWENGYKDVVDLTADDINSKIEELNA